jgi:hypothetical protein
MMRVIAIGVIVTGHWLLVDIRYQNGRLSGRDALAYIDWAAWLTLIFQVLPVFFLVGGRVNAASWLRHHRDGVGWAAWVQTRAMRLLWPATTYLLIVTVAVTVAVLAAAPATELAQAAWLTCLHLWFLPVYLLLIALTPVLLAAHRRYGLLVPAVMSLLAAAVDLSGDGRHPVLFGLPNYVLVWGAMHQWGFAWLDGSWLRRRWYPFALAGAGATLFAALVTWGSFPVDLIGTTGRRGNTSPPTIALLAFAAAQCGLVLVGEPVAMRLLEHRRRWRRGFERLNPLAMTIYLWHMIPVIIVAVAVYPAIAVPNSLIGSPAWWALRLPWLATLAVVLAPLTIVVTRLLRFLSRVPTAPLPVTAWSLTRVAVGIGLACWGLVQLAVHGAAPHGQTPVLVLIVYCAGVLLATAPARRPRRSPSSVADGE